MHKNFLRFTYIILLLLTGCCTTALAPSNASLYQKLSAIDGIEVTETTRVEGYFEGYKLLIKQPLDHQHPEKGYFKQRVYIAHQNTQHPTVIETDGYTVNDFLQRELPEMLNANMISVEYRFYGKSKNAGEIPWEYLTLEQGAADHHRIISLLKSIYPGPWINTGYSKGGESALFHRRYYPDDVVATIAYDAPLILGTEDPRTDEFIKRKNAAAGECGRNLVRFQRELLQRRNELIPALARYAKKNGMQFSNGLDVVLEYAALEYTFSFWQRGQKCEDVPAPGSSPKTMLRHIETGGGFYVYSDTGIKNLEPSFYQHMTQLGYYGFITDDLKDLLTAVPNPSNRDFLPKNIDTHYNANIIPEIIEWLQKNGNNIIYLYGENDTWYSCAVDPGSTTNAITLVQKNGYHATKVKNLEPEQKKRFYDALSTWIDRPIIKRF